MNAGRRRLLPLIAILAALLCLPAHAAAVGRAFSEPDSFDGEKSPAKSFEDACGLAVDSFGDIYVADYYHHVVDVYAPGDQYLTQVALPPLNGACGLAVDSTGTLYVDTYHEAVTRYTPSSFPPGGGATYGGATVLDRAHPTGVVVDPAGGDLYVDERSAVEVFGPEGAPLRRIELPPGSDAYGVAVSDAAANEGDVYVADATSGEILVYDPLGILVDRIDGSGDLRGRFVTLADAALAIDQTNGDLVVAEDTEPGFEEPAAAVDEFGPTGDYRGELAHPLVAAIPSGLATTAAGDLYVGSGNGPGAWVYSFGPTGPESPLVVTKSGEGEGTIHSEPAGIMCGESCVAEYFEGTEVILEATPAAGSAFSGWTGCARDSGTECVVTAGVDQTVTASFAPAPAPAPMSTPITPVSSPTEAPADASPALRRSPGLTVSSSGAVLTVVSPSPGTLLIEGPDLAPLRRRLGVDGASLRPRLNRRGIRARARAGGAEIRVMARLRFDPAAAGADLTAHTRIRFTRATDERKR
jgi:DNA-binding beta-propeller fold protein YncE